MVVGTWKVWADPDRNGTYTDITSYFNMNNSTIKIARANPFEGGPVVSSASLNLRNISDDWSLRNSSGSFYGYIKPRIPVKVTCNTGSGDLNVWVGFILSFSYDFKPGINQGSVSLQCVDILGLHRADKVTVASSTDVAFSNNTLASSGAVNDVLKSAGFGSSDVVIRSNPSDSIPLFFLEEANFLTALKELCASEPGFCWVDTQGSIVYYSMMEFLGYSRYDSTTSAYVNWGEFSSGSCANGYTITPNEISEHHVSAYPSTAEVTTNKFTRTSASSERTIVYAAPVSGDYVAYSAWEFSPGEQWQNKINTNVSGILYIEPGTLECLPGRDIIAAATPNGAPDIVLTSYLDVVASSDNVLTIRNTNTSTTIYLVKFEVRGNAVFYKDVLKTQEKSCGTGASDSGIGTIAWASPSNVTTEDGTSTSYTGLAAASTSEYLKCTNFGFNLPTGAIITSVEITPRLKITFTDLATDATFFEAGNPVAYIYATIVKNDTIVTPPDDYIGFSSVAVANYRSNLATFMGPYTTEASQYLYYSINGPGNGSWSTPDSPLALTPEDVNASTFGCALYVTKETTHNNFKVDVDHVKIIITYRIGQEAAASVEVGKQSVVNTVSLPHTVKGTETIKYSLPWRSDENFGRDYAMTKLRIYQGDFFRLKLKFIVTTSTLLNIFIQQDFQNQIKYKDIDCFSGVGKGASYSHNFYNIESIEIEVSRGKAERFVFTLIPCYFYRNYLVTTWDDFDRSNTSSTPGSGDLGVTPTGDAWVEDSYAYINNGQLRTSGSGLQYFPGIVLGESDMIVEADIGYTSNVAFDASILFRNDINIVAGQTTGWYLLFQWQGTSPRASLRLRAETAQLTTRSPVLEYGIDDYTNASPPVYVQTYFPDISLPARFRIVALKDLISVYINNSLIMVITDNTYYNYDDIGILFSSNIMTVDNYYAQGL